VVPGTDECVVEFDQARDIANKIGYPVIIKPSGGGGGIGMRLSPTKGNWRRRWNPRRRLRRPRSVFVMSTLKNTYPIRATSSFSFGDSKGKTIHLGDGMLDPTETSKLIENLHRRGDSSHARQNGKIAARPPDLWPMREQERWNSFL